jgi:hypothetical protein
MSRPRVDPARARRQALRVGGVIAWSAFLSAAAATMVCFAFVDPQAWLDGNPPAWWGPRLHVYAIGFFFFWGVGFAAATLAWYLAHGRRMGRR